MPSLTHRLNAGKRDRQARASEQIGVPPREVRVAHSQPAHQLHHRQVEKQRKRELEAAAERQVGGGRVGHGAAGEVVGEIGAFDLRRGGGDDSGPGTGGARSGEECVAGRQPASGQGGDEEVAQALGRFVRLDEVASMVAWLGSEECSFSTGAVFDLSGGRATC